MFTPKHQLSVKYQIDGEEEGTERSVDQMDHFAWDADSDDAKNEEDDDADKEDTTTSFKKENNMKCRY